MNKLDKYNDLLVLYNRNSHDIQKLILKNLTEPIFDTDELGWLYGFYSPKDKQFSNNFWIKLGRTERNPLITVEELRGKLIFCMKTNFNHRLERLVHLFFDFAKESRVGICEQNNFKPKILWFEKLLNLCGCLTANAVTNLTPKPKKEIGWFHFTENINVHTLTARILELVEETFGKSEIDIHNKEIKKININTASYTELICLPHIGKNLAEKIIEQRKITPFKHIDEIKKINKIVAKKFIKISEKICI